MGSHKRIHPDHVAEVIKQINADVICLQETIDWMPPKYKEFFEKHGVGEMDERMRQLNSRLKEQGFGTLLRSCSPPSEGSPNLVACRIPVVHSETLNLAPEMAEATVSEAMSLSLSVCSSGTTSLVFQCRGPTRHRPFLKHMLCFLFVSALSCTP